MMLLDGTNFRGSDADEYVPGQNIENSYQDSSLDDSDSYQSNNPSQIPDADSGYNFANEKYGQQDSEFQEQYQNQKKGGLAKQAGRALGKVNSNLQSIGDFTDDSPENRERLKEEAKKRIRKYAKDKVKDKFGEEMVDLSKDAFKKAGKNAVKNVGKQVGKEVGKDAAKLAVRGGAKVAANVGAEAGAEAVVAGLGVASAPETLGIGLLISILLEIALYLGLSDALDYSIAMAKLDFKKAKFHAYRGGMTVLMGVLLILAIGLTFSFVGWIVGVPLFILLNIYMLLGLFFPSVGLLQGLSKKLLQIIILYMDTAAIITFLVFAAAIFWYICDTSGLGTGFFANVATKVVDWWNGNDFASTFNDVCTQISKF